MTDALNKKLHLMHLLLMCLLAHSQQSSYSYPDFFYTTYPFMLNYDNPAYIVDQTQYNLYAQYKQRLGQFRKVVSYSALGEKVWRREGKSSNSLKLLFNNENDGPYIARPRFSAGYANEIPLRENLKMALGFTVGATSINFSAPNQGASGNSYLPDGKLGFVIKGKTLEAGISSLQFLGSKAKVIGANITLKRYYNLFVKYKRDLSPNWVLEGLAMLDLRGNPVVFTPQLAAMVHYKERISFGASQRFGYAFSSIVKVRIFPEEAPLDLILMYNSPAFTQTARELNSIEIALALGIE